MSVFLRTLGHAALGAFSSALGAALQSGSSLDIALGAAAGSAISSVISFLARSPLPDWMTDGSDPSDTL